MFICFNDCAWRVWTLWIYCVTVNSVVLLHCCSCDWFCVVILRFVWQLFAVFGCGLLGAVFPGVVCLCLRIC